jgi:hypothetical protein
MPFPFGFASSQAWVGEALGLRLLPSPSPGGVRHECHMPLPKIKDAKGAITMQILHQLTIIHPELLNSLESTVRIENPPYMPLTIENIGL